MRNLLIPIAAVTLTLTLLCACSRTPQPIVESIEQAQQSKDVAKNIEQTMQKSQGNPEKKTD